MKKSFLNKYINNKFEESNVSLLTQCFEKIIENDTKKYYFAFIDLGRNHMDFKGIDLFKRGIDGCIVMSDCTKIETRKE